MRMTNQREIILEELRNTTSHPTADELYLRVKERLPRISLATVYRNLEKMAELGLIQKIKTSGYQTRFDGNPNFHYHIRCIYCGKIDDLPIRPIKALEDPEHIELDGDLGGYKVVGFNLEFLGICPECMKTLNNKK